MAETGLKEFLLKLHKNYNILREREAKYATAAPLDLLNQLDDYTRAIEVTEQAIEQNIPLDELQDEFSGLNLQIETVVFVTQEPPRKPFTGRNPYRGLRSFTEDEAEFYFGRTAAIQSLLDTIKGLVHPPTSHSLSDLVTVMGPSGSGKSSLVRAGLIPALRAGQLPGSEQWLIKVIIPGPHPLDELAGQLAQPTGQDILNVRAALDTGEQALHRLMIESLDQAGKPEAAIFVLVVDQFEEVFTLCNNEAERQAFLAQLLYVSQTWGNRGLIILTMRADFYSKAAAYKRLAEVITQNQMLVSPMTERELREAILLPAEAVGLELEKALVEVMLKDTADAPGVLPLLQHALTELFHNRDGNLLTLEAYQQIGGVKGALAHRADAMLDSMPMSQRHITRRIFMRLVQSGEGAADTRRRATFSEVLPQGSQPDEVETVIQILVEANLIVTSRSQDTNEMVLDVSHDTLLREWPRFKSWLDWDRRGLHIRQALSLAARDWHSRGRDQDSLYRGARLLEAEEWAEANPGEINELEQTFLQVSTAARNRAEAERRKRTQRIIAGLVAGLILVTIGAVFGFVGQQRASVQAANAQTANAQANLAKGTAESGQVTAVAAEAAAVEGQSLARQAQVTAEARRVEAERQSQIALAQSLGVLALDVFQRTNDTELAALLALEAEWLNRNAQGNVEALIDQTLRQVLSAPHFNVTLSGHEPGILSVAVSPNGQTLASVGDDGLIWLRSLANPAASPTFLSGHEGGVSSVAFSPDSRTLASAGDDQTIRLWDMTTAAAPPIILSGHEARVRSVAFSPNGQTLASASDDQTVRLWDIAAPTADPTILSGHEAGVVSVAFSPDGQTLASAGDDQTIRLWDTANLSLPPTILNSQEGGILSVAFSPDGRRLASGSINGPIRLWDVATLPRLEAAAEAAEASASAAAIESTVLPGHTGSVFSVAFSPDSQTLASASFDQTIRLWNVADPNAEPAILSGPEANVWSVAFKPDGRSLVSGSSDGAVRLWAMTPPVARPTILAGHEDWVEAVAFSPDGQLLASASDDRTIRLWRMADPTAQPAILKGHTDRVRAVAFSPAPPDGSSELILASASEDQTIQLWTAADPAAESTILSGHEDKVVSLAFSPDGQTLASASTDGTVRLWQPGLPSAAPTVLIRDTSDVLSVAFNPAPSGSSDSPDLAFAGSKQPIRLWLGDPLNQLSTLGSPEDKVRTLAFSPAGQILAAGSDDGVIRLWDLANPTAAPTILRGHESGVLAVAFSPDGQTLASAGVDQTIRLWDLANPTAEPTILRGHTDRVLSVAFSPTNDKNGQFLASGSADGTVQLWIAQIETLTQLACQQVRRNLTAQEWRQFMGDQPYRRTCRNRPIHPSVIEAARDLARAGQVEAAVAQIKHLLSLHPTLGLNPEAEAQQAFQEAVQKLLNQGKDLARAGQTVEAIAIFKQALQLDPSLNLDPESEVQRLTQHTAKDLLAEGLELAQQGDVETALTRFEEAETLDSSFKVAAEAWHTLCVKGTELKQAQPALLACNRAIELEPDNGLYFSSRGLVRSLAGDQAGAIEDFKTFREWLERNSNKAPQMPPDGPR